MSIPICKPQHKGLKEVFTRKYRNSVISWQLDIFPVPFFCFRWQFSWFRMLCLCFLFCCYRFFKLYFKKCAATISLITMTIFFIKILHGIFCCCFFDCQASHHYNYWLCEVIDCKCDLMEWGCTDTTTDVGVKGWTLIYMHICKLHNIASLLILQIDKLFIL